MPTGYTDAIKDGISFEQFALRCARAFGALVVMRDDPLNAKIPDEFQPSDWHSKKLKQVQDELANLTSLSEQECQNKMDNERKDCIDSSNESIKKRNILRKQYEGMLSKVNAWNPPSGDHYGLKKFMREQIEESIKFDCDVSYDYESIDKFPSNINEWKNQKLKKLRWDINYHTKENSEEIERTKSRNLWVKKLRESLK